MIPDDQVEEVRLRADIVDVISEYVPLKKSGKDYKARCPFHEERTPSFYVVPSKGFYNCFGCGESGDVFSFLMKKGGLDFVEAVRHVAGKVGIELRETRQGDEARDDPHRALYEVNAFARSFYAERLADEEEGRDARDYLASRGVDDEIVERFGLGYAPDDWRALRDAAAVHGFDDALLLEVGLLSTSEKAPEPYDRFRDRVVFPIEDLGGRVVAFGARVLGRGDKGPKYMNSPETPVYHKSDVLYGLSWSRHNIRRERAVLVVEGYMDLVSLAAAGFENVVAPLGTSMTEEHARLLSRYTKRVFLLFDSDRAGLEATFRAGDVLLAAGLSPAVVTLPPGEDPDTVVRKEGRPALQGYLDDAVDVLDRKLQILEEHDWFRDIERTRQAVDRLLPTLRAAADATLRDIYVAKVADRTGVKRETLEAEMERERPRLRAGPGTPPPRREARAATTAPRLERPLGAERSLLLILARDRERREHHLEQALKHLGPEDFTDPTYRAIFQAFLDDPELSGPPEGMDPTAARRLQDLLEDPEELLHAERVTGDSVARIRLAALARRSAMIDRAMAEARDEAEQLSLMAEQERLAREKREIGRDWSHTARMTTNPTRGE